MLLVDKDGASARETLAMIERNGGRASVFEADVTSENLCRAMAEECLLRYGRIDAPHNNVGIGTGDSEILGLGEEAWDLILSVNLKSAFLACKHVLPVMREQRAGSIINISSLAAVAAATDLTAYKVSKAGLNALTQVMAIGQAPYGIRVNAIMPGFIETPMAIEGISQRLGIAKDVLIRERNSARSLARKDGHSLGRGPGGPVPGFRRGSIHYRCAAARRRRTEYPRGMRFAIDRVRRVVRLGSTLCRGAVPP